MEQETAQRVQHERSILQPNVPWVDALTLSYTHWSFVTGREKMFCSMMHSAHQFWPSSVYYIKLFYILKRQNQKNVEYFKLSFNINVPLKTSKCQSLDLNLLHQLAWQMIVCDCNRLAIGTSRKMKEGRKCLTTHSTHFIYSYMESDIWLRTILIVRKKTRCRHIGYSFRLAARVLLYAQSHRQDSTYHDLRYTSHGSLAGTRNSSMGPPHEGSIRRPIAPWANALTTDLHLAPSRKMKAQITAVMAVCTVNHWIQHKIFNIPPLVIGVDIPDLTLNKYLVFIHGWKKKQKCIYKKNWNCRHYLSNTFVLTVISIPQVTEGAYSTM